MIDKQKVLTNGLIASDDKAVRLEAQSNMTALSYISYLVSNMVCVTENSSIKKSNMYGLVIIDDMSGEYSGSYFKVVKNSNQIGTVNSLDVYQIDIGAVGNNLVTAFSVDDNQAYSILYDYSEQTSASDYVYRLNNNGQTEMTYSPSLVVDKSSLKMTESTRT